MSTSTGHVCAFSVDGAEDSEIADFFVRDGDEDDTFGGANAEAFDIEKRSSSDFVETDEVDERACRAGWR